MNARIKNELNLIKDSVLQSVQAEAIYLFGSYAYGNPTALSDIDIYVVVPDNTADLTERYADIREHLSGKKTVPLDLLLGRSSVFHRRKSGPTLERVVAERGTKIYGV